MSNPDFENEVVTQTETEVSIPKLYKVVLHNDDKTTVEFVIMLLTTIFHKHMDDAVQITYDVHNNGRGIAGLYTKEIAQQKVIESAQMARANKFPLKVTYEED